MAALLAFLALILIWPGVDILLAGDHPWLGIGMALLGLWAALAALMLAMGALDAARQPDPLLDIGPEGVLDRRLSPDRIAWADLEWDRVALVTQYGRVDQVRIRLKRPYRLRGAARIAQLLGRVLPMGAFRGRPLFVGPLGPDATTDRIAAVMAQHRAPSET